jgi:tetratricopeptide (TPR) repeat protein
MRRAAAAMLVVASLEACGAGACGVRLLTVEMPDLSRSDPPVQAQIREAFTALEAARAAGGDDGLRRAYGELGMVLHAAEYWSAAEAAYLNAQALAPDDRRWPYFLGHVFRETGATDRSLESFERARALQPSNVPGIVWLARTYLTLGRPSDAEAVLQQVDASGEAPAAVLAALGEAALAADDATRAAAHFEQALAAEPRALKVHGPLAAAYRMLGDLARAETHARRWKDVDVPLADPLMEELATLLRSAVSYELRGVRAFDEQKWDEAARIFREGLELTAHDTPIGRSLRHKLGLAFYLGGDARRGIEQFEEAVRLAPSSGHDEPAGRAHYSLGIIMGASGRDDRAVGLLRRAIEYDETSVAAHLALGDALRRLRRDEEALVPYKRAVEIDQQAAAGRLGHALALIRLRRHAEARAWLEEAVRAQPDQPELAHALARLLAASPDPGVRDARRAGEIVGELFKSSKRTEIGETMAMALAELGLFQEAIGIQRGVLAAAERAGLRDDVRRMEANLRLFEQGRPSRSPWPDDDPIHRPGPPVSPQLAAMQ